MQAPAYGPFGPLTMDMRTTYRPPEVKLCRVAAAFGDLEEVKRLVRKLLHDSRPAEPEEPIPKWLTGSLNEAAARGDAEMVRFLLDEKVGDDNLCYFAELAVRARAFKVLELFLEYGWDINQPINRTTPPVLGIPLCTHDRGMVDWLFDHGADPNARCAWDFTPTSEAVYAGTLEDIDYLFSRGADTRRGELLQWAVIRDKPDALDVVRRVIERGAPIDEVKYAKEPAVYRERVGFGLGTPLHRAAEFGKTDIVKYLLEQGADPLKLDSKRKTPRFWAEMKKYEEVARILKEAED